MGDFNLLIREELSQLIDRRNNLTSGLTALQREADGIDASIRTLRKLLARLNGSEDARPEQLNGHAIHGANDSEAKARPVVRGKTTMAILNYLRERGDATANGVALALRDHIETKSGDPERVIRNTLLNLRRNGLVHEHLGHYRVIHKAT